MSDKKVYSCKITLHFNLEREGFCLQALRTRINIHFGPPCRNDAISWKKNHLGRRYSLFAKQRSRLGKTSHLDGKG